MYLFLFCFAAVNGRLSIFKTDQLKAQKKKLPPDPPSKRKEKGFF
jgi:hypothetical protein